MQRSFWIWLTLLAFLVAMPAFAGEEHKDQAAHEQKIKVKQAHKDCPKDCDCKKKCKASTQDCLDKMVSHYKNTGWVGIEYDVDKETGHWTIVKVIPGSPAETAGIQPGDILFAMYGIELGSKSEENLQSLKKARAEWKPGQEVVYTLKRNGGKKEVTVTLGAMPADVLAQWVGRHMMDHAVTGEQVAKVDK